MFKDILGQQIDVGSFVVYTTNAESSGLRLGQVDDIIEKPSRYNASRMEKKIRIRPVDVNGQPEFEQRWDSASQQYEPTSRLKRLSTIDFYPTKFLVTTLGD